MEEPIFINDTLETWIVYPEEHHYRALAELKPDKDGIRHIDPKKTKLYKGWWYPDAVTKAEESSKKLEVPWDEFIITEEHIREGDLTTLSTKLARIAYFCVKVNQELSLLRARQISSKEALEHATNKIMALKSDKGTVAERYALTITKDKQLRNAKIESIECQAMIYILQGAKDNLDLLWKTVSRLISARASEPID